MQLAGFLVQCASKPETPSLTENNNSMHPVGIGDEASANIPTLAEVPRVLLAEQRKA